jgi:hypothetical protein
MPVFLSAYKTPDDDTPCETRTQPAGVTADHVLMALITKFTARKQVVQVSQPSPGVYFVYCRSGKFSVSSV